MDSGKKIQLIVKRGVELAGAAAGPAISLALGDPSGASGAFLAQAGVVITQELTDFVDRQQSDRELVRAAGAITLAVHRIQQRREQGEEIRDDDFFRVRSGTVPGGRVILDGVLTKAKHQYEEQKALILGEVFTSTAFDSTISAADASWLISCVDRLTYRHLLILAHFADIDPPIWHDNNLKYIAAKSSVVVTQIRELRSVSLLSHQSTYAADVVITEAGKKLVEAGNLRHYLREDGAELEQPLAPPPIDWRSR